ncbi:hypothetical protein SDC9_117513 [bioreactor metagenome]|uniref:DUF3849 domain-containing protein n=1 Tax=bioreactor metagenome TaxID=1076179 RepID=A0A645BZN8_9ZZZZ
MEMSDFPYVYPYSSEEAKRLNQLPMWRESFRANIACKNAIEQAVRRDFDGMHLKTDCAGSVIAEYGYRRVSWVLANTVQQKSWDGRFSRENKEWAKGTYIPPDKHDRNLEYVVESHPAVLDGFVNQYRKAYQALGLFDYTHCEPDTNNQDFMGKVLVMSTDNLKESCWSQRDQLWLATGGFGCRANSSGRAVFATCLSDGEDTRFNRTDFVGVLKEELLPDWAREKLMEIKEQRPSDGGTPGMGGMEMK